MPFSLTDAYPFGGNRKQSLQNVAFPGRAAGVEERESGILAISEECHEY